MANKDIEYTVHDYGPLNKAIDENLRIKRTRSVWGYAKSVALILIALGIFLLLLAWAYSLLNKHYILNRVAVIQERVVEEKINEAISSGQFSKTTDNLSKLGDSVGALEDKEKAENKLEEQQKINENLSGELESMREKHASLMAKQNEMQKKLEDTFGNKVKGLENENQDLVKQISELQDEIKNNPEASALQQKFDELEQKFIKVQTGLIMFITKTTKVNLKNVSVNTRYYFSDPRELPNKSNCYIDFGPSFGSKLRGLELGGKNKNFSVDEIYLESGFDKSGFLKAKKNHCDFDRF